MSNRKSTSVMFESKCDSAKIYELSNEGTEKHLYYYIWPSTASFIYYITACVGATM